MGKFCLIDSRPSLLVHKSSKSTHIRITKHSFRMSVSHLCKYHLDRNKSNFAARLFCDLKHSNDSFAVLNDGNYY